MLTLVATGACIALTHESVGRFYARDAVVFRPVADLTPSTLAIAWRADDDRAICRRFVDTVVQTVAGLCKELGW
jgi:DNA-binding transcriptional LysR family regulator